MLRIKTIALGILGVSCGVACGGFFNYNPCLTVLSGIICGIALPIIFQPSPSSFTSCIDRKTLVTANNWAVTLIQHDGPFNQHAVLVIEGVKDDIYPPHFAHLTGRSEQINSLGEVKYKKINDPNGIIFERRTEVFSVPYAKMQKMIAEIKKEKGPYSLNILGRHSWFASEGQDSCITWALEKLKMLDIQIIPQSLEFIFTCTSNYTEPKEYYSKSQSSCYL